MKTNLNDNVLNFPKGKRLPSMEGMSDEDVKNKWERQEQLGITEINIDGIMMLSIPNYVIEQKKEYLRGLSRPERRRIKKDLDKKMKFFSDFLENKIPQSSINGSFENVLEVMHHYVIYNECFNQLKNEKVS